MKTTASISMTGGVMTTPHLNLAQYPDWEIQLCASLDAPGYMPKGSTKMSDDYRVELVSLPILDRLVS